MNKLLQSNGDWLNSFYDCITFYVHTRKKSKNDLEDKKKEKDEPTQVSYYRLVRFAKARKKICIVKLKHVVVSLRHEIRAVLTVPGCRLYGSQVLRNAFDDHRVRRIHIDTRRSDLSYWNHITNGVTALVRWRKSAVSFVIQFLILNL